MKTQGEQIKFRNSQLLTNILLQRDLAILVLINVLQCFLKVKSKAGTKVNCDHMLRQAEANRENSCRM